MFNFFKKKQGESSKFNVLDINTWQYATSEKSFVWKDNTFYNIDTGKDITEFGIVDCLRSLILRLDKVESRENLELIGTRGIIENVLDSFSKGMSADEAFTIVSNVIKNMKNKFDIFDPDSWEYAENKPFFWKDSLMFTPEKQPITEKDLVNLFGSMFKFLERNGQLLTFEKKKISITTLLDRMVIFQSDPSNMDFLKQEEESEEIHDNIFNPRDTNTYKFAREKPLIIDGIKIIDTYIEDGNEWDRTVTEYSFAQTILNLLKINNINDEKNSLEYINAYIKQKTEQLSENKDDKENL